MKHRLRHRIIYFLIVCIFSFMCSLPAAAEAKTSTVDVSAIRGVNYEFEGKSEARWRSDLELGKRVNLNSVRIWLSLDAYTKDPTGYISSIERFVQLCGEMGYTVMPIIFNGNSLTTDNHYILDDTFQNFGEKYVKALTEALCDEPGFLMFDIMNEPCCNSLMWDLTKAEDRTYWSNKQWDFVRHYCQYIKTIAPDCPITVGCTTASDINKTAKLVDVLSYHDYSSTMTAYTSNVKSALRAKEYYGKPVINTETGCVCRGNPYDMVFEVLQTYEVPFYFYGLTVDGYWKDVHGIFYPDGTVRDPAAVAALLGFYRNRDYDAIVTENLNREKLVSNCLQRFQALVAGTDNAFAYNSFSMNSLLNICEEMACFLEAGQVVGMSVPPTARVQHYREMENPNRAEVLDFAYEMAKLLREACHILP